MTKPRTILWSFLAGILVLVIFLGFIKFKTDEPILVHVDNTELIYLQANANTSLNDWENRSREAEDGNYYVYLSEQELMEKSQLTLQANQVEETNELFYGQNAAKVEVKNQRIVLDSTTYQYQDKGGETDPLRRYSFEEENSPISSENLSALVSKAMKQTEARNKPIWKMTWRSMLLFIGLWTVGILMLFYLERVATGWLQLFIKGAEAGPILKMMLGIGSGLLIVGSFIVLYSVTSSINW